MSSAFEVNFDGIVGPTHNYSGLSHGNIASVNFKGLESSPREAVLQGLEKMKKLADEGFVQGVLPPQERPALDILEGLGFLGRDNSILNEVSKNYPEILSGVSSASCMWTANAATISPSADTADGKVHFTPANLISKFHRSIEARTTAAILKKIFKNPKHFVHHEPLPSSAAFSDEGAANHTRLCTEYGKRGVEFFVYGRGGFQTLGKVPQKFPARQTREACEMIARRHLLKNDAVVFARQTPEAIDAGVFHNDVIGVGNRNFYFYHEKAYVNSDGVMKELEKKFESVCKDKLLLVKVRNDEINLDEAVKSYLFNSQVLSNADGSMTLVAPSECQEIAVVHGYLRTLLEKGGPVKHLRFFNLRQSMRNGGGPACLRLRVALTEKELKSINKKVLMNDELYSKLVKWAHKYYRDRLTPDELGDAALLKESRAALDALSTILGLGAVYPFQQS